MALGINQQIAIMQEQRYAAFLHDTYASATQIDGCPLLVNNSRWGNFGT